MHSQRAARPARPPPPLQHPIPTHPKVQVPESPLRSDFAQEDNAYAPAAHYTPQARPQARPPPKKRDAYTRISSPRSGTPVGQNAYAPQPRGTYTPQQRPRPPAAQAPARGTPAAYAPPSRSNSAASVVPNMNMYQPASMPFADAGTTDAYPNAPPYAATPPQGEPWNWGGGAQPNLGSLGGGMMNDATAQMGMQFGRHVAQVGGEYMQRNVRPRYSRPVPRAAPDADAEALLQRVQLVRAA